MKFGPFTQPRTIVLSDGFACPETVVSEQAQTHNSMQTSWSKRNDLYPTGTPM